MSASRLARLVTLGSSMSPAASPSECGAGKDPFVPAASRADFPPGPITRPDTTGAAAPGALLLPVP